MYCNINISIYSTVKIYMIEEFVSVYKKHQKCGKLTEDLVKSKISLEGMENLLNSDLISILKDI